MMKHLDLFCASPASTAICSSMDHRSIIRSPPRRRRHHHQTRLGDSKTRTPVIPCSSSQLLPIDPKTTTNSNNKNRGRRSSVRDNYKKSTNSSPNSHGHGHDHEQLMKTTLTGSSSSSSYQLLNNETSTQHKLFDLLSDSDQLKTIHVVPENASPLKSTLPRTQVVELMVSIHCKGCEGKVRKHISRLEGVKSVSIDLASKKVTVVGDVTPSQVLTSISRVKIAQFWPYADTSKTPSSTSTSPLLSSSQMS